MKTLQASDYRRLSFTTERRAKRALKEGKKEMAQRLLERAARYREAARNE